MTAQIVGHFSRRPYREEDFGLDIEGGANCADLGYVTYPGQLWERVAER